MHERYLGGDFLVATSPRWFLDLGEFRVPALKIEASADNKRMSGSLRRFELIRPCVCCLAGFLRQTCSLSRYAV